MGEQENGFQSKFIDLKRHPNVRRIGFGLDVTDGRVSATVTGITETGAQIVLEHLSNANEISDFVAMLSATTVPSWTDHLFAGIDLEPCGSTAGKRLRATVFVFAVGREDRRLQIDEKSIELENFSEFSDLVTRLANSSWNRKNGSGLSIARTAIDAGFMTEDVLRLANSPATMMQGVVAVRCSLRKGPPRFTKSKFYSNWHFWKFSDIQLESHAQRNFSFSSEAIKLGCAAELHYRSVDPAFAGFDVRTSDDVYADRLDASDEALAGDGPAVAIEDIGPIHDNLSVALDALKGARLDLSLKRQNGIVNADVIRRIQMQILIAEMQIEIKLLNGRLDGKAA